MCDELNLSGKVKWAGAVQTSLIQIPVHHCIGIKLNIIYRHMYKSLGFD